VLLIFGNPLISCYSALFLILSPRINFSRLLLRYSQYFRTCILGLLIVLLMIDILYTFWRFINIWIWFLAVFFSIICFRQNILSVQNLPALNPLFRITDSLYSISKFLGNYLDSSWILVYILRRYMPFCMIDDVVNMRFFDSTCQKLSVYTFWSTHSAIFERPITLSYPLFQCWLLLLLYKCMFVHLLCI